MLDSLQSSLFAVERNAKNVRTLALFVFFVSMALTLFLAYATWIPDRVLLIVVLVVVQSLALAWYLLSYIPFARQWVASCCTSLLGQGASGT